MVYYQGISYRQIAGKIKTGYAELQERIWMLENAMKQLQSKRRILSGYVFCALVAAVPLIICSKSSPLYPFNDWPDVNMFFTMGKGMLHGRVPYMDLMEQKGPYVYAIGAIGYLLSPKGFQGYFLFELISMFCFIFYAYKTIRLYSENPALWVLPFLSAGVVAAKSFVHGGSLEELSLGIFAYAIYSLLLHLRSEEKKTMPAVTLAVNGMWAGILFWSKFTLLGLYIAWIMVVALEALWKKRWREFICSIAIFLGAMSAMTIPWLIYFGAHGAVVDWLKAYLWDNIFGYAQWNGSLLQKFQTAILNVLRSLKDSRNGTYSILTVGGTLFYACCPAKKVTWKEKIAVACMGLFMGVGIFVGETKHDYYGLPLSVFVIFGGIGLVMLSGGLAEWLRAWLKGAAGIVYAAFLVLLAGVCTYAAYRISPNTYLLAMEQEQMPQFRFAERIQESSDRSVLNYGFLDGGFYTVLEVVPSERAFCVLNRNPGEILEEQNRYVRERRTHFVVTWRAYPVSREELLQFPVVSEYYELVDYLYFEFEGGIRTYALYERRKEH